MTDPTTPATEEAQHGADYAPPAAPPTDQPTAEQLQALIAQVQAMQAELNAARGIPTDPVGAAVADLKAHVTARVNAGIEEYAELKAALEKLGETVTAKESDLLRTIAADVRVDREGAPYVKQLANDLHKNVLTNNE